MSQPPGRTRSLASGRGAQLLAALEASRRPGQPPVEAQSPPVPASPDAPTAAGVAVPVSPESTPASRPVGRAAALHMLARRHVTGPQTQPTAPPPTESQPMAPPGGRGAGRLAMLRATQQTQVVRQEIGGQEIVQQVTTSVAQLSVTESYPMPILDTQESAPVIKKGVGGKSVDIIANYIRLNVEPGKGIFQYEVRFEPNIDSRDMRFKLLGQHRELLGPAKTFDGSILFLPFKLTQDVTFLRSQHIVTNEPVTVKIILKKRVGYAECANFYNVLFKKIARILGMVQMSRNYFHPSGAIQLPVEKLEVWPGYVTAIREYEDGLMLCCDVSFRVLRTTTVYDELVEMSRNKNQNFQQAAQNLLVGLSVLTRYNNKTYKIDEILFDQNPQAAFDCQGKRVTYIQYYKEHYDIDIKDKEQPLLLNRLRKKVAGKEDETVLICLIPELCFLTGLDDRLRSDFKIMRSLATHTKVSPMQREKALEKYIDSVNSNEQASRVLGEWGLSLAPKPLRIDGRNMGPERIHLGRQTVDSGLKCDWSRFLGDDILCPVKIDSWVLVCTDRNQGTANDFSRCMLDVSKRMGMRVNNPKIVTLPNDRTDTYVNRIRDEINPSLQLVVAIFPTSRDDRYSAFKVLCNAQNAVPSQAINLKTISNPTKLRSVVQKIALQINCKLGGELWAVNIPTTTLMVCGVDVYHDPTKRGNSVVGFVSSTNPALTRWYSRAKHQSPGQELVDTLKICFLESLKKYYEMNHGYPTNIVLFRDGVSDGQLPFVSAHEVPQMMAAIETLQAQPVGRNWNPKFTMVVVQKRINARFFAVEPGKTDNPKPGTVIDHTVTRRDWWDFFLVSQYVTQGTVTPTHFIVVHDGGMPPDHLQKLSYKMTHMYYNWPGTIRVPAPCQYAHKLAYLIGENIRKDVREELCNRLFYL